MVNYVIEYSLLLPPTNGVMFSHLSVILSVCLSACWDTPPRSRHPSPWEADTPWKQTPPRSRHPPPPPKEADTPPGSRHPWEADTPPGKQTLPEADTPSGSRHSPPAQCMLGDTGNKRVVRILLECILVRDKCESSIVHGKLRHLRTTWKYIKFLFNCAGD